MLSRMHIMRLRAPQAPAGAAGWRDVWRRISGTGAALSRRPPVPPMPSAPTAPRPPGPPYTPPPQPRFLQSPPEALFRPPRLAGLPVRDEADRPGAVEATPGRAENLPATEKPDPHPQAPARLRGPGGGERAHVVPAPRDRAVPRSPDGHPGGHGLRAQESSGPQLLDLQEAAEPDRGGLRPGWDPGRSRGAAGDVFPVRRLRFAGEPAGAAGSGMPTPTRH